jgi:hypothetical protein
MPAALTAAVSQAQAVFNAWHDRYRNEPVLFVREVLGAEPDPWQQDVLNAIARGDRGISIRSGNGVGKTACLAWAVVWHILCRFPQKTACTAPTSPQLFDALVPEVFGWIRRLPPLLQQCLHMTSERIEHSANPDESFVSFKTSRPETPEALAGVHSQGSVLLIADEASGIPDPVFESASGSMSDHNACTVLAGNPVRTTGMFYDTHNSANHLWTTFQVNGEDVERVDRRFIQGAADQYGIESNYYRIHVLGEFPKSDDDAVIPRDWMEAALTRKVDALDVREIWGLDCAGGGADNWALARRKGNVLAEPVVIKGGMEPMQGVGWVKSLWDKIPFAKDRPTEICIDSIGVGAGVAGRLQEMGIPARSVNVSESPALEDRYLNLRAELWFAAREWFERRDCNLCGDKRLGNQLVLFHYFPTSNNLNQIEPKEKVKKNNKGRSPDEADAFVLTFAGYAISASSDTAAHSRSWNAPIKRKIAGIV